MHIKTANGKKRVAMSRREWEFIGKQAGWHNDIHPLDRKQEIFHGVEGHEDNYYRRVWASLVGIYADVEHISEKAFAANDELHARVEDILRKASVITVVDEFEEKGMRPEFCAEKLYSEIKS